MTHISPSAPADLWIHQVTKQRDRHVPPLLLLPEAILANTSKWGKQGADFKPKTPEPGHRDLTDSLNLFYTAGLYPLPQ